MHRPREIEAIFAAIFSVYKRFFYADSAEEIWPDEYPRYRSLPVAEDLRARGSLRLGRRRRESFANDASQFATSSHDTIWRSLSARFAIERTVATGRIFGSLKSLYNRRTAFLPHVDHGRDVLRVIFERFRCARVTTRITDSDRWDRGR